MESKVAEQSQQKGALLQPDSRRRLQLLSVDVVLVHLTHTLSLSLSLSLYLRRLLSGDRLRQPRL